MEKPQHRNGGGAVTTKNYIYGLLPPTEGRDLVLEQLKAGHDYQNMLVEIELERRKKTDETLAEMCPKLLAVENSLVSVNDEIEAALSAQKQRNKEARTKTDTADMGTAVADLRKRRREIAAERKRLRDESFADAAIQKELAMIGEAAKSRIKQARRTSLAYWGTRGIIEQAADAFRKGAPPIFRGYRGEGRIAVQLQGGLSWEDAATGNGTLVRIAHTPQVGPRLNKRGQPIPMPGKKKQGQQYTLWIRIGSDGRAPIWAKFPMILHRPIHDGCLIMWAIVSRRIIAGKERWELMLTLRDNGSDAFSRSDSASSGTVGIDVGYRVLPSGRLRVAYVHGDDGSGREYAVPFGKMREFSKIDDIQSIRDNRHNEARSELKTWIAGHASAGGDIPGWLAEAAKNMHAWRRLSRLDQLVIQWRKNRFGGDSEILTQLESWRTKERHLWQYQENLRDQLLAWRKDFYRNIAREIARRYKTVCVEKLDLRELHDVLRPKDKREVNANVRRAARTAGLSMLLQYLREAASETITVAPENTTKSCHACGGMCDFDDAKHLRHTCEHCGVEWDQDDNAARNILARGQVMLKKRGCLASVSGKGVTAKTGETIRVKKPSRSERFRAARKNASKSNVGKR